MSYTFAVNRPLSRTPIPMGFVLGFMTLASGYAAIAYELLYLRVMTNLFGDIFYVHGTLLSTFLIGIGFGARYASRLIYRLWILEIAVGLYAWLLPMLLLEVASEARLATITGNPYLTVFATFSSVIIPSLMIGCALPVFSAYLKSYRPDQGVFKSVYGLYNLGAFLSIFTVELMLVKAFGIQKSLAWIGLLNISVGCSLFLWLKRSKPVLPVQDSVNESVSLLKRDPSKLELSKKLLIALAGASFASAIYQMFFLKLTYLVFEPHRENFSMALAIVFLGMVIGAWISAKTKLHISTCLLLVGLSVSLIFTFYQPILGLYLETYPWETDSYPLVLLHRLIFASIFGLLPMIFFGALIPSLMNQDGQVATKSGQLIALSSFSNAVGYLFYLFLAHPIVNTDLVLLSITLLVIGLSLWTSSIEGRSVRIGGALLCLPLAAAMVINWEERYYYLAQIAPDLQDDQEVQIFKSGGESATLLIDPNYQWLSYNGHPSIYIEEEGVVNTGETLCAVLPSLSAPKLDRAMVLGFGTGITAGTAAQLFKNTDVAEINAAFFEMSHQLAELNFNVSNNPKAHLNLVDARAFLNGKTEQYDLIINSIPAPTYFTASKVYTLEFYQSVAKALTEAGVFATWLSSGDMSDKGLELILGNLSTVFSYCSLALMRDNYYMLTCSRQPMQRRSYAALNPPEELTKRLQQGFPEARLEEILEDIFVSDNIFESYSSSLQYYNRDDHPILEFELVKSYGLSNMGGDPFFDDRRLFHLRPLEIDSSVPLHRFFRRVENYYWLDKRYYDQLIKSIFDSEQVKQKWIEYLRAKARGDLS